MNGVRKASGWMLSAVAVAAMVLGNFSVATPIASVLSDVAAALILGLGLVLIVV